jgi:[CysO sulfur-carrier protein]-S-L-cysteine hydrolase
MNISTDLLEEIVRHALENPAIECCGLVAVESGTEAAKTAMRVYRTENIHASALKFEIDPMEQYRLTSEIEELGWQIGAIYHSHVRSEPKPSQTDISFAAHAGNIEWIIVGLAGGQEPEVRSYLIDGGVVREVALQVQ